MGRSGLEPTHEDLQFIFNVKYGPLSQAGWGPRMRRRSNYYTPDDHYEALIAKLIDKDTNWLDLGCGRNIFPSNPQLARILADRCRLLVGVDPDETLEENSFVHLKVKSSIDEFRTTYVFNLITLRMVAEHISDPAKALDSLKRLTCTGSRVVVYTINRWSPVPVITRLVPFRYHHFLKRILWKSEQRDTFPVAYRMNSRNRLKELFEAGEFEERCFLYLDDCTIFGRFRFLAPFELYLRSLFRRVGVRYPEYCLLGVYERR